MYMILAAKYGSINCTQLHGLETLQSRYSGALLMKLFKPYYFVNLRVNNEGSSLMKMFKT